MFGGLRRNEQGNNVFAKLMKMLNPSLIGVGCSVHVLNNCILHWAERMNIDIENNINKIYQYFSIYTVRTELLKEYCEFANCKYKTLSSHSKTRWLSLFPGISRLLEMFSSLKFYFLSQKHPLVVIKRFFENEMSELYLGICTHECPCFMDVFKWLREKTIPSQKFSKIWSWFIKCLWKGRMKILCP